MLQHDENEINEMEVLKEETVSENEEHVNETSKSTEGENDKEINTLKELLSKKEAEAKELMDRAQRLAAEFDNFRKRTQKEKERLYIDAAADVVSKFIPVVDNLERALKASETEESQGLRDGVTLVFRQIADILDKLGVKVIEAVGQNFNPELHNAVMHVEDESLDPNIVVEELQKGYIYKDEIVIRYSMVKVAN